MQNILNLYSLAQSKLFHQTTEWLIFNIRNLAQILKGAYLATNNNLLSRSTDELQVFYKVD